MVRLTRPVPPAPEWFREWVNTSTHTKQPPSIPATSSTADLLGELYARQDECMQAILLATAPALKDQVFNTLAELMGWTQAVSNIHWRAIGVANGPMLTSEPSPAAAASTAFKASSNLAPGEPA